MSDFSKSIATSTTSVKKVITSTASKFDKNPGLKFKYSLYSALAFFLLASPQVFSFVNSLIGSFAADNIKTLGKDLIILESVLKKLSL